MSERLHESDVSNALYTEYHRKHIHYILGMKKSYVWPLALTPHK